MPIISIRDIYKKRILFAATTIVAEAGSVLMAVVQPVGESVAATPGDGLAAGLRIAGLSVDRGNNAVLSEVDLEAPVGGYTCVLGASGSGKSTLLSAVAGTLPIRQGYVEVSGEVLCDTAAGINQPPQRRRLGMVFQDYLLWPHLSAGQNVSLPLQKRHGTRKATGMAREWLSRVGLDGMVHRYPAELSGGQQQRVALARALALRPRMVLLDEPLSALDADMRLELRDLLRRLAAEFGFTALHVTHDSMEALSLADRLVVMSAGRVVQAGPCEEVFMRPATRGVARLTGMADFAPVPILARNGEHAWVAVGETRLRVAISNGLAGHHDNALLVLRPHAFSQAPAPGATPVRAHLVDACFLGDHWQVQAELAGGIRIRLRHDARPSREFQTYLHAHRIWAIPEEQSDPDPAGSNRIHDSGEIK